MQALNIDPKTCNHQIDLVGSGGQALIDKAKQITIYTTKSVGGNNAKTDFIRYHYERFISRQSGKSCQQFVYSGQHSLSILCIYHSNFIRVCDFLCQEPVI